MTKPRLKYGNGTWSANCPAGAWGVGTTPEEAYKRWSGIAQSMRDKAIKDQNPLVAIPKPPLQSGTTNPTADRLKAMIQETIRRAAENKAPTMRCATCSSELSPEDMVLVLPRGIIVHANLVCSWRKLDWKLVGCKTIRNVKAQPLRLVVAE